MKYALLSVTDKTELIKFAKALQEQGFTLVSSGGTWRHLQSAGIEALPAEQLTGQPEMLSGRVKTLHPKLHGALLYRREDPQHQAQAERYQLPDLCLVCVNLYDFESAWQSGAGEEQVLEQIDIGGPALLRSAAKNWRDVWSVSDPADYPRVIERLAAQSQDPQAALQLRWELAGKAFARTARYDQQIASYFQGEAAPVTESLPLGLPRRLRIELTEGEALRYGENPHQQAALYTAQGWPGPMRGLLQRQGKALSFNNLHDVHSALQLAYDPAFTKPLCAVIKHATPCAVAQACAIEEAFAKAQEADPLSIFGGVVALNRPVDQALAERLKQIFLEVVIAPGYSEQALRVLAAKPALRLLEADPSAPRPLYDVKCLAGQWIIQSADQARADQAPWQVVTKAQPSPAQREDLLFAMQVCAYARSNAVVIAKDGVTWGIGGGQTARVWALESALRSHPERDFKGAVLASDAFFPFPDSVQIAAKAGLSAIIQPGGAKRDAESIALCDAKGLAMVFTGQRRFRH